jgi:hypothetical protein
MVECVVAANAGFFLEQALQGLWRACEFGFD